MNEAKLDPLTVAELDELERLEREATVMPWRKGANCSCSVIGPWESGPLEHVLFETDSGNSVVPEPDARLIAAARNALPRLIAMARKMVKTTDAEQAEAERDE